jgi:hypothetical protein
MNDIKISDLSIGDDEDILFNLKLGNEGGNYELVLLKRNIECIINNDPIDYNETCTRYQRYLQKITNWMGHDYIQELIYSFLNKYDHKTMTEIDLAIWRIIS